MSLGLKKGDKVEVVAGRDKGKTGKVLRKVSGKNRLIVEGVHLVKKHIKRRSEGESQGIKEIPISIDISNVSLFCANCNKGSRFGVKISADKSKVRICKRCQRAV